MSFGISFQPLSGRIYAGQIRKGKNVFQDKSDVTNAAVAAVAEYVLTEYPEGMSIRRPDGSGWEIDVKALPKRRQRTDGA